MTKPKLSTIFICLGLFAFFSLILFPYQNLKGLIFGRIYKQTHINIMADELYVSIFSMGIGLTNADVTVPMTTLGFRDPSELELSAKRVVLRLGIAHIFPPTPSISLTLKELKKGGDLWVKFSQTSSEISSDFSADQVELSQLLPPTMGGNTFSGVLTGDSTFDINSKDPSKSAGKAGIKIDKFRLGGLNMMGFVFAPTNIGQLDAKLQVRGGSVEIGTFKLGGPKSDLSGSLSGDVRLGPTMMQDYLNLTLRLALSESYRQNPQTETLQSFLSTYQTTPGNYSMKWAASLTEMSTNTFKALPQKATP